MFKKIKNYFKGLFVNKRQETLLKTIKVWDDASDLKVIEEEKYIKIVGEWAEAKKPRKPRAKKAKVEDSTTEKVNEVKPKKRNYRKRKPKADKAD